MDRFSILTTRKRAVIALVHSVAFLMLACFTSLRTVAPVSLHSHYVRGLALLGMYAVVTVVLCCLFLISGCVRERLYFALCTSSAGTALIRTIVGDRAMHGVQYLRVLALICAVLVGGAIVRSYSPEPLLVSDQVPL
jgi:hypothetical protein